MNTLVHLGALLALLWLAIYCFGTLEEAALGYAAIGLFLAFIPLTILAATDDWNIIRGYRE